MGLFSYSGLGPFEGLSPPKNGSSARIRVVLKTEVEPEMGGEITLEEPNNLSAEKWVVNQFLRWI
jgi:hypothetical protein